MVLFSSFVFLQVADAWTTHRFLTDKTGVEKNPVLAGLFEEFGHIPVLIAVKSIAISLTYFYLIEEPIVLGLLVAFYIAIVINNLRLIK